MSSEVYYQWAVEQRFLHQKVKEQVRKSREALAAQRQEDAKALAEMRHMVFGTLAVHKGGEQTETASFSGIVEREGETSAGGFSTEEALAGARAIRMEPAPAKTRRLVDLSGRLVAAEETTLPMRQYARELMGQLEGAVLLYRAEKEAKNEFVTSLNKLLQEEDLEFTQFQTLADRHFAKTKTALRAALEETDAREEYLALCAALGAAPGEPKGPIAAAAAQLEQQLSAQAADAYVEKCLEESLEELGLSVGETARLDGLEGQTVFEEGIEGCAVFVNRQGGGMLFEMVSGEDTERLSGNETARLQENTEHFCEKQRQLVELMRKKGVELRIEAQTPPDAKKVKHAAWLQRGNKRRPKEKLKENRLD